MRVEKVCEKRTRASREGVRVETESIDKESE